MVLLRVVPALDVTIAYAAIRNIACCLLYRAASCRAAADCDIPYAGEGYIIGYAVSIWHNTAINLVDITYRLCYTNTRARS